MNVVEQQIKKFNSLIELLEDLEREGIEGRQKTDIVRDFFFLKARTNGIPYSGGFELTPLCNFDCKMCYVHLSKQQMENPLLSPDQWMHIMQQAVDAGMMYAELTGGECLTYPTFKDVYLYLLSRGVRVSVLTNGSLMTEEMADFFAEYRPEIIQVSLYGSNENAYEMVTGHRSFAEVLAGISRLKSRAIRTKIVIMPHRYMKADMDKLLSLVHSLHVEYAIGDVNLPPRENTGRVLADYIADVELVAAMRRSEQLYYELRKQDDALELKPYQFSVPGLMDDGGIPCASGRCGFHVNWKGELTPCIPYYMVTASVLELGFSKAWESIRKQMRAYRHPKECEGCASKHECFTCPAERTFGILNGPLNTFVCDRIKGRQ